MIDNWYLAKKERVRNMGDSYYFLIGISFLIIVCVTFFALLWKYVEIKRRYQPIINAEFEAKKILNDANIEFESIKNEINNIKKLYLEKKEIYDSLHAEIVRIENSLENSEICLFDYEFSFKDSEEYKRKISENLQRQKDLVREKQAISCESQWTVGGSVKSGKKMINEFIKSTLRAFNSECDMIISRVSWRNYQSSMQKIEKSFLFYNNYSKTLNIKISDEYLKLKFEALRFAFEEEEKRQQEKEEQREIRERIKDEERLEKDRVAAEKEEKKYLQQLEVAKTEISRATGQQVKALELEIERLTEALSIAKEKSQRALSMAQQTKSGYVYVISNIGSFGDDVFKIGMTRRLEPYDRVRELGDASVPFEFDVHAMIACEDAPALEKKLHSNLEQHKMNLINNRREFFKAPLSVIVEEVKKEMPNSNFIESVEADQYNKSVALRLKQKNKCCPESSISSDFPDSI